MTDQTEPFRAGRYIKQLEGYSAFIPQPLPPTPPVRMDAEIIRLLSDADRALGRLDGVATVLPNPDLFVAMYVKQEAVFSSQIEGTQSTLEDVLEYEAGSGKEQRPRDVEEVVNYVAAMNMGLERLKELSLSLRLIREIHEVLLRGVRGGERTPGEFRRTQNWVGPANCTLLDAEYVPPPPHHMKEGLSNLEKFLHDRSALPVLIHCALAHAQFETIHPFLDGNGRMGRLLITFLLCERHILNRPLLYLSYYLKAHRAEYYDRLMAIRNGGDWEGWVKFFLRGVYEVSQASTETARAILHLREDHRQLITEKLSNSVNGLRLLDRLFEIPLITIRVASEYMGVSYVTASSVIQNMEEMGILKEITGQKRNKVFRYEPYMKLFSNQAISLPRAEDQMDTVSS
ncbi:MAG: Fic family protein [Deltaproteobacteria bacterium]|jgi:Fic family protein|nr:Fic family protein [Deltaproteobacteria bacterium]